MGNPTEPLLQPGMSRGGHQQKGPDRSDRFPESGLVLVWHSCPLPCTQQWGQLKPAHTIRVEGAQFSPGSQGKMASLAQEATGSEGGLECSNLLWLG